LPHSRHPPEARAPACGTPRLLESGVVDLITVHVAAAAAGRIQKMTANLASAFEQLAGADSRLVARVRWAASLVRELVEAWMAA